ncbi:G-rich sequence factor 1 [Hypomesus transpacificus]|uniref:G-rich sequence factor 1 n=1 Tax=Hypomesus transpacificus TaxID=137520 RepID=UPI001F07207D|nr:G-rich sequence factor 1 [Hypomesus transpacificus]
MSGKSILFAFQRCFTARRVERKILSQSKSVWNNEIGKSARCGAINLYHYQAGLTTYTPRLPSELNWKINQRGLSNKAETPIESDEYPPLPEYRTDPEPPKKEVYIIHAKGLPWTCTAVDLLHFFSECRVRDGVKGIHLTVNQDGKPSGQAFIEVEHEEDVSKALEKHRQYLGSRYVEVYEVTDGDAEAILKKSVQLPAEDGVVRLRGLPYSCTEADILFFFSGLDVVKNGVTFVTDGKGRLKGEAFVQFSSHEMVQEALQRDRELIGNRYIEVFPSQKGEILSRRRAEPTSSRTSPSSLPRRHDKDAHPNPRAGHPPAPALHYVHMRGLPFHATGEDVVEFFSPLALSRVLLECGPDGRPSGEAQVFFTCHKDAVSAMSRDKARIDERYIELFLNSAPVEDQV